MALLRIQLLGAFQLQYQNEPVADFTSSRLQTLLAYLLLHRSAPQARQQIAYHLWPVSSESQARTNLRKLILQLRHTLPDAETYLRFDNQVIQWRIDAPFVLDVDEVQQHLKGLEENPLDKARLTALFEIYGDQLLPSCYDDWIVPLRTQLHQEIMTALDRFVTLLENQRAYEEGIRYTQRLLTFDPLDEKSYQRLMRLRALNGDRAGALQVYQECTTVLARELGVEPSAETEALYTRLLNQGVETKTKIDDSSQQVATIPLVGRQREWQILQQAWTQASRGKPHFICIQGEAGIGKTRLAEELVAWVREQGAVMARTRAYQVQGTMAYAPITELLRNATIHGRFHQINPIWLVEIMRLLPELAETFSDLPQPQPMTDSWQRQRLFEALARAMLLDGHPLLILLDDLQWCERETLEWFDYFLRFNPQARLLIVGTLRTGENIAQQSLDALSRNLHRDDLITLFSLQPLSVAETSHLAQLLSGTTPKEIENRELFDETAGNPLFVVETVRANLSTTTPPIHAEQAGLPPKIYAVIQARLSQLSPEAQTVINLAAVIGRSFTYQILFEAARLDEDELVDCLDELWQRQIIREQSADLYDFAHDRMRDVAYAEISSPRRRQLHRRIANALEKVYAQNLNEVVGELALHYGQIGEVEKAISYYLQAADFAKSICAYEKVGTYANQGLTLLQTSGTKTSIPQIELALQLSLGTSLSALNGYADPRVEGAFQQSHQLSEVLGDNSELYPALHGLAMFYMARGDLALAKQLSARCLRLATTANNRDFLIEANMVSGLVCYYRGEFNLAKVYFEESYSHYDFNLHKFHFLLYTQDPAVTSLGFLGLSLWVLGYPIQAMDKIRSALDLAQRISHPYTSIIAQFCLTWLSDLYQEDLARDKEAQTLVALSNKYESHLWWLVGQMYQCRAQAELGTTNKQELIDNCHNILIAYRQTGTELARPFFLEVLAKIYFDTDQYEKGLATINESLTLIQSSNERQVEVKCYLIEGDLLLATNAVLAESAYLNALHASQEQNAKSFELRAATRLARLYVQQGQIEKAYQTLAELYAWFTEGFETHDLLEAKALLHEIVKSR